MKTLVEKMDVIKTNLVKRLDNPGFTEPEYVGAESVPDVRIQPTAVASESTTLIYCHNNNTAFIFFNIVETTRKLPKGYVFLLSPGSASCRLGCLRRMQLSGFHPLFSMACMLQSTWHKAIGNAIFRRGKMSVGSIDCGSPHWYFAN